MKNTILRKGSVAVAVLGIGALLSACGGGGGSGSSSSSGSGFTTTSAYIQDDVSNFPNVTVGIYSISLLILEMVKLVFCLVALLQFI